MTPSRRTTRKLPTSLPSLQRADRDKVQLDWKAYFLNFCRVHGEPVEHGGRLLFRDGWTYSSTDYEGPEWGPPDNLVELDILVTRYWVIRQGKVSSLLNLLTHRLKLLKEIVDTHSLPLQQVVSVETEAGVRRGYKELSLSPLESRIEWVRCDLLECEVRLKELETYRKTQNEGVALKERTA